MSNRRTSFPKCMPEKEQPENEGNKRKGREHRSSSRKHNSIKYNNPALLTPEKHKHFEGNRRKSFKTDNFQASSSFSRQTTNCCKTEQLTGVSIKDVGLDIAGFLIEEEIKQNKEKLKLEIIRQIALSRELDKHLERQRHIMNNYICHNTLEGTAKGFPSQNINDFIDKCNCMVCQEAAMENVSPSTSMYAQKLSFSEKSLQANRTGSVSNKTIPESENDVTQLSPLTKDVSCQEMCQECNEPDERNQLKDCRKTDQSTCTPLQSDAENCTPCIERYIEDCSNPPGNNNIEDVTTGMEKLDEFDKQKDATTMMTNQTLSNLNNILKTPLNTIEPQTSYPQNPREDATEMILSNIKSIIRDYMENMNINCNKCQFEPGTSKVERSNSYEDNNESYVPEKKSSVSTRCENDGTHIDIVMQFCESNNKKKAILEIEPCFDERKCMKFCKKKCVRKKVCGDTCDDNLSSCSQMSICNSVSSRKFSPYPIKDRTSFRKCSKPNITCRSRKKSHNYCKQRKCPAMKERKKSNISATSCSSNHSIEIIKVNRCSRIPVCESSSSDSTEEISENHKPCCKPKNPCSKNHRKKELTFCKKKSTICTYMSHLGGLSNKQSKETKENSRDQSLIQSSFTEHLKPALKQENKTYKQIERRSNKSKMEHALIPFLESTKQDKECTRTTTSTYTLQSSNLDETSYRELQIYGKSGPHSRIESKSGRTSNTCTTVSLNLDSSNLDILGKRENETILYSYPSDIISMSENWSINRFLGKNETLPSSNRLWDTKFLNKSTRKLKAIKDSQNVNKGCKPHTSSSSDQSFDKSEIIKRHKNQYKSGIRYHPKKADSESSGDETQPIKNFKTYTKINSDGVVIMSPLLETKRAQLIQEWLSYIHKLQAKKNFEGVTKGLVAVKMPKPSNRELRNDDSNQEFEYLLAPKPVLSNDFSEKNVTIRLKGSVFENFQKAPAAPKFNGHNTNKTNRAIFDLQNSSKWAMFQKGKKEVLNDPIKRTATKQNNKNSGLDCNKSKSEVLHTESSCSSEYNFIGSSISDSTFDTTTESILDVNENNHDELIQELICPIRNNIKGKYFDVSETDKIINRAFYIQDIFVKLASTEEEKEYWRDTVLRAMKNIVTKTS